MKYVLKMKLEKIKLNVVYKLRKNGTYYQYKIKKESR